MGEETRRSAAVEHVRSQRERFEDQKLSHRLPQMAAQKQEEAAALRQQLAERRVKADAARRSAAVERVRSQRERFEEQKNRHSVSKEVPTSRSQYTPKGSAALRESIKKNRKNLPRSREFQLLQETEEPAPAPAAAEV